MDKYDVNQSVQLKKGVYKLNAERNFDYQLNRVINWDGGKIEDIRPVAGKIKTSSDWKRELIALGDKAMEEGRTQNAIAYYRMSEFFMYDGDPDKKAYYEKATQLFYQYYADYFEGENPRIEKLEVPYETVKLPVMQSSSTAMCCCVAVAAVAVSAESTLERSSQGICFVQPSRMPV